MHRHALVIAVVTIGAALLGNASAGAATVSYSVGTLFTDTGDTGGCSHAMMCGTAYRIAVTAAPGEANALRVTRAPSSSGSDIVIQDTGAPPSVAPGSESNCRVTAPDEVRCTLGPPQSGGEVRLTASVAAGDRDDEVTVAGLSGVVAGDAGNDTIAAGPSAGLEAFGGTGTDRLSGGDSGDTLVGGDGADSLAGGAGGDSLDGDGPGAAPADDIVGGGPGTDRVAYSDRTEPVTVDLLARTGGQAVERDALSEVENVTGGRGADALSGDDGPNWLEAGAGPAGRSGPGDRLTGLGGEDVLIGSPAADALGGGDGADTLAGGRGDDSYDAGTDDDTLDVTTSDRNARAHASCGTGDDSVLRPVARTVVATDCERAELRNGVRLSLARTGRTVAVAASSAASPFDDCGASAVRLRLLRGSRLVGTAAVARLRRSPRSARFTLTPYGRRLVARGGPLRLSVAIQAVSRCSPRRGLRPAGGYQTDL